MTDDFLRRHPEIVQAWEQAYNDLDYLDGRLRGYEATTRTIPAILAAHEADLAGDAPAEIGGAPWDLLRPDVQHDIDQLRAAAYLAGRRAGREEAERAAVCASTVTGAVNAIRSLP